MKLLMVLVDSNHQKHVEEILDRYDVPGYTKLSNALGKGRAAESSGAGPSRDPIPCSSQRWMATSARPSAPTSKPSGRKPGEKRG
jgi:hypothetical protein